MDIKKKRVQYTKLFRDTVIKSYFRSDKSIVQVAREYGVNEGTLCVWINKYRDAHSFDLAMRQEISTFGVSNQKPNTMKKEPLTPEQMTKRIAELEARLEREQMHRIVLDNLIDIAERDFDIRIRKKDGAKQSK